MTADLTAASRSLPDNVRALGALSLDGSLDGPYWIEVMNQLRACMGAGFADYNFIFHSLPTKVEPDVAHLADPRTVLFILSDNSGRHYENHFAGFKAVFKVHLDRESSNVFPIPLGYTKHHLHGGTTPASERNTRVFYSGNINANRMDLWRALFTGGLPPRENIRNRKPRSIMLRAVRAFHLRRNFDNVFPNSHIRFTDGFTAGLDAGAYSRMLADSMISISPRGFWRPECFRHFESMRSGCVVISDPLPPTWYFKDCPIIQIPRWSDLRGLVNSLLADEAGLKELQSETVTWWETVCSPAAVANHIVTRIS